jgi:hypothetical protein
MLPEINSAFYLFSFFVWLHSQKMDGHRTHSVEVAIVR